MTWTWGCAAWCFTNGNNLSCFIFVWSISCQTYDGGIAAVPDTEAHGGYAFCGLAAASLLGCTDVFDLDLMLVSRHPSGALDVCVRMQ